MSKTIKNTANVRQQVALLEEGDKLDFGPYGVGIVYKTGPGYHVGLPVYEQGWVLKEVFGYEYLESVADIYGVEKDSIKGIWPWTKDLDALKRLIMAIFARLPKVEEPREAVVGDLYSFCVDIWMKTDERQWPFVVISSSHFPIGRLCGESYGASILTKGRWLGNVNENPSLLKICTCD